MESNVEQKIAEALANPKNMGELEAADAVGTVGSPGCGDMLRMWIRYKEENGRKVIDRATFQSFGCETAIAVASVATELIRGKTPEEALAMNATDLAGEIGPLPPMKIHCGQLVEGALRSALGSDEKHSASLLDVAPKAESQTPSPAESNLYKNFTAAGAEKAKIIFLPPETPS